MNSTFQLPTWQLLDELIYQNPNYNYKLIKKHQPHLMYLVEESLDAQIYLYSQIRDILQTIFIKQPQCVKLTYDEYHKMINYNQSSTFSDKSPFDYMSESEVNKLRSLPIPTGNELMTKQHLIDFINACPRGSEKFIYYIYQAGESIDYTDENEEENIFNRLSEVIELSENMDGYGVGYIIQSFINKTCINVGDVVYAIVDTNTSKPMNVWGTLFAVDWTLSSHVYASDCKIHAYICQKKLTKDTYKYNDRLSGHYGLCEFPIENEKSIVDDKEHFKFVGSYDRSQLNPYKDLI